MTEHFDITTHTLIAYQDQKLRNSKIFLAFRWIYSLLLTLVVTMLAFLYDVNLVVIGWLALGLFVVFTFIFCFTPLFAMVLTGISRKMTKVERFPVTIALTKEGLTQTINDRVLFINWSDFKRIYNDDEYFFLATKNDVCPLPLSSTENTKRLIYQNIKANAPKCKGIEKLKISK
ncbi:hypothetical protein FM106_21850 [Brachybacterium faecium]|nr:hypothetical protein FM106_21850 [Brachybacterium faecium]